VAGMLLIRTDADVEIGTGHAMRCLALARAWQAAGGRAVMLGHRTPEAICRRLRAADVEYQPLGQRHPDPADLATTLRLVDRLLDEDDSHDIPWLVVDGYHFDAEYIAGARQSEARLMVIDDLARLDRYDADVVLNQNLGAEKIDYPCDEHTSLLLGSRYVLLRQEFASVQPAVRAVPEGASKVLVTLGGADPENVTATVIRALELLDLPDVEAKVVVGGASRQGDSLQQQAARSAARVQILRNVEDMPGLMAWADVAVAAAGCTAWELAYSGLPAVLVELADNQEPIARRLADAGAAVRLGRAEDLPEQRIADELAALCRDAARRRRQSEAGRRLIDGRGVSRVIRVMQTLDAPFSEDHLEIRPAEREDARSLWRLANDPAVRKGSLSSEPIAWDEHAAWFERKLADDRTRIWVLDFDGLLLAVIRYERTEEDLVEVSLSVAAPFRRRGLASRMVRQTWQPACDELRATRVRAVVRRENAASRKTFVQAGFAEVGPAEVQGCPCEIFEKSAS
jgi:UDP-2,4-diacetamido-2,4,6-trideoxy-beta-L-altropyranose hydrolase